MFSMYDPIKDISTFQVIDKSLLQLPDVFTNVPDANFVIQFLFYLDSAIDNVEV